MTHFVEVCWAMIATSFPAAIVPVRVMSPAVAGDNMNLDLVVADVEGIPSLG